MDLRHRGVEALYAAGHWFLCARVLDKAEVVFQALMLAAPEDARGWLGVGACYEERQEPEAAFEMYELGLGVAGVKSALLAAQARVLFLLDREEEANERLARAEEEREELGELATTRRHQGAPA